MAPRSQLAVVQLATFVGGCLLAPVAHLAWHPPDHTHGPGGRTIVRAPGPADHRHAHAGDDHRHPHDRGQADGHGEPRALPSRREAGTGGETREATAEPLDVPHGHGSVAHLGLALLSAPPALALPTPAPAGAVAPAVPPRPAALFHPRFPRPRPPPGPALT